MRGRVEATAHGRAVRLLDAEARMREHVRGRAVVGEQQHAARVVVEPSHRDDARRDARAADDVGDRPAALRIAHRRHRTGRLVQHDVRVRLRRPHDAAVDLDARVARNRRAERAHDGAADAHAPGDDQLLGPPARRDACGGEVLLKPQGRAPIRPS